MKVGDLVRYGGTGALYLCLWVDSDIVWCRLLGFDEEQFHIDECNLEVISESR